MSLKPLEKYHVEMIAIVMDGFRESEEFVAQVLKTMTRPVYYVIVNAGLPCTLLVLRRAEFPELHVEQRSGSVSVGDYKTHWQN